MNSPLASHQPTTHVAPTRRMLIAFAHPDDESFGLGALIGRYVAEGVEVYYLCATDGDVGTVSPDLLEGYNSVRELRLAELDRASAILGFRRVYKLGYRDSGMMGASTNHDPASLWYASQHQPDSVERRVVEVIREVQPQVIITFNRYGGYGHPDHIAIQRATTAAFALAADPAYDTGQPAYTPQKLYYTSIPKRLLQWRIARLRMRGEDPRRLGRNKDIDMLAILDHVEPVHAVVDVRRYFAIWDAASAVHVSQGGGGFSAGLPRWTRRWISGSQRFTRVAPRPARDVIDERDLFAGVQADGQRAVPQRAGESLAAG